VCVFVSTVGNIELGIITNASNVEWLEDRYRSMKLFCIPFPRIYAR